MNSPVLTSPALRSTSVDLAAKGALRQFGRNLATIGLLNSILGHAFFCGSLEFRLLEMSMSKQQPEALLERRIRPVSAS